MGSPHQKTIFDSIQTLLWDKSIHICVLCSHMYKSTSVIMIYAQLWIQKSTYTSSAHAPLPASNARIYTCTKQGREHKKITYSIRNARAHTLEYSHEMLHTSRRVSSGFGVKSSLPLTRSIYNGGSCSIKGRTCFIIEGLRFSNCFMAISA